MECVFQTESLASCFAEMEPLLRQHWREMRERIPLEIDQERYLAMDAAGLLQITTARAEGQLVGYNVFVVMSHLHHRGTLHAVQDVYYLLPQYRRGWTGIHLLRAAEKALRDRGVVQAYTTCKLHHNHTPILLRLGWQLEELTFGKALQ